jgi:ribonuclease HII
MYAGVDEAGRGPVLGPLVVAGVAGDPDQVPDGVDDSKQLTAETRNQLASSIEDSPLTVAVCSIPADELNERMDEGENLNRIEAAAFAEVLRELETDDALLDQVGPDGEAFADEVADQVAGECAIEARVAADEDDAIVGAASIVAKVERDRAVAAIAEELDADVGSGYAHDERTRAFLEDWRETSIHPPPYTRHAWSTLDTIGFGQARLGEDPEAAASPEPVEPTEEARP